MITIPKKYITPPRELSQAPFFIPKEILTMTIYKIQLNETERINYTANHFGKNFPFRIEPFIYDLARTLSGDYAGGYWNMYELSIGGFYMAPESDTPYNAVCLNGYEGTLSADAFGITVCLYAYSNLSFSEDLADVCGEQYHLLREFMFEHPEVREILAAIEDVHRGGSPMTSSIARK